MFASCSLNKIGSSRNPAPSHFYEDILGMIGTFSDKKIGLDEKFVLPQAGSFPSWGNMDLWISSKNDEATIQLFRLRLGYEIYTKVSANYELLNEYDVLKYLVQCGKMFDILTKYFNQADLPKNTLDIVRKMMDEVHKVRVDLFEQLKLKTKDLSYAEYKMYESSQNETLTEEVKSAVSYAKKNIKSTKSNSHLSIREKSLHFESLEGVKNFIETLAVSQEFILSTLIDYFCVEKTYKDDASRTYALENLPLIAARVALPSDSSGRTLAKFLFGLIYYEYWILFRSHEGRKYKDYFPLIDMESIKGLYWKHQLVADKITQEVRKAQKQLKFSGFYKVSGKSPKNHIAGEFLIKEVDFHKKNLPYFLQEKLRSQFKQKISVYNTLKIQEVDLEPTFLLNLLQLAGLWETGRIGSPSVATDDGLFFLTNFSDFTVDSEAETAIFNSFNEAIVSYPDKDTAEDSFWRKMKIMASIMRNPSIANQLVLISFLDCRHFVYENSKFLSYIMRFFFYDKPVADWDKHLALMPSWQLHFSQVLQNFKAKYEGFNRKEYAVAMGNLIIFNCYFAAKLSANSKTIAIFFQKVYSFLVSYESIFKSLKQHMKKDCFDPDFLRCIVLGFGKVEDASPFFLSYLKSDKFYKSLDNTLLLRAAAKTLFSFSMAKAIMKVSSLEIQKLVISFNEIVQEYSKNELSTNWKGSFPEYTNGHFYLNLDNATLVPIENIKINNAVTKLHSKMEHFFGDNFKWASESRVTINGNTFYFQADKNRVDLIWNGMMFYDGCPIFAFDSKLYFTWYLITNTFHIYQRDPETMQQILVLRADQNGYFYLPDSNAPYLPYMYGSNYLNIYFPDDFIHEIGNETERHILIRNFCTANGAPIYFKIQNKAISYNSMILSQNNKEIVKDLLAYRTPILLEGKHAFAMVLLYSPLAVKDLKFLERHEIKKSTKKGEKIDDNKQAENPNRFYVQGYAPEENFPYTAMIIKLDNFTLQPENRMEILACAYAYLLAKEFAWSMHYLRLVAHNEPLSKKEWEIIGWIVAAPEFLSFECPDSLAVSLFANILAYENIMWNRLTSFQVMTSMATETFSKLGSLLTVKSIATQSYFINEESFSKITTPLIEKYMKYASYVSASLRIHSDYSQPAPSLLPKSEMKMFFQNYAPKYYSNYISCEKKKYGTTKWYFRQFNNESYQSMKPSDIILATPLEKTFKMLPVKGKIEIEAKDLQSFEDEQLNAMNLQKFVQLCHDLSKKIETEVTERSRSKNSEPQSIGLSFLESPQGNQAQALHDESSYTTFSTNTEKLRSKLRDMLREGDAILAKSLISRKVLNKTLVGLPKAEVEVSDSSDSSNVKTEEQFVLAQELASAIENFKTKMEEILVFVSEKYRLDSTTVKDQYKFDIDDPLTERFLASSLLDSEFYGGRFSFYFQDYESKSEASVRLSEIKKNILLYFFYKGQSQRFLRINSHLKAFLNGNFSELDSDRLLEELEPRPLSMKLCIEMIIYECTIDLRIRSSNVEVLNFLTNYKLSLEPKEEPSKNRVQQRVMGGGKTLILGSMTIVLIADDDTLPFLVTPKSLARINSADANFRSMRAFGRRGHCVIVNRMERGKEKEMLYTEFLEFLQATFEGALEEREFIITTKESLLSLYNGYKEAYILKTSQLILYEKIFKILKHQVVPIFDEIDSIFNPFYDLNYPISEPVPMDPVFAKVIFKTMRSIKEQLRDTPYDLSLPSRSPLERPEFAKLCQTVEEDLKNFQPYQECMKISDVNGCKALFKAFMRMSLFDILNAKENVKYGLLPELATVEFLEKIEQFAKPFKGAGLPSRDSQFSSQAIALAFTILAYMKSGLSLAQKKGVLKKLSEVADLEAQTLPDFNVQKTPTNMLFRKMNAAIYHSEISLNDISNFSDKRLKSYLDGIFNDPELVNSYLYDVVLPSIIKNENYISSCAQDFLKLFKKFIGFSGTIENSALFDESTKLIDDPVSLGMIMHLLTSKVKSRISSIKSSDPLNGLRWQMSRSSLHAKFMGKESKKIMRNLPDSTDSGIGERNQARSRSRYSKNQTIRSRHLKTVEECRKSEVKAVIDVAASLSSYSNEDVAIKMMKTLGLEGTLYFAPGSDDLYFAKQNEKPFKLEKSDAKFVKEATQLDLHQRFTLYDETHTRGVDLRQKEDAVGILTYSINTKLSDFLQAVMRLRGFLSTQKVIIVYFEEEEEIIRKRLRLDPSEPIQVVHLLLLALQTQDQAYKTEEQQAILQRFRTAMVQNAFERDNHSVAQKVMVNDDSFELKLGRMAYSKKVQTLIKRFNREIELLLMKEQAENLKKTPENFKSLIVTLAVTQEKESVSQTETATETIVDQLKQTVDDDKVRYKKPQHATEYDWRSCKTFVSSVQRSKDFIGSAFDTNQWHFANIVGIKKFTDVIPNVFFSTNFIKVSNENFTSFNISIFHDEIKYNHHRTQFGFFILVRNILNLESNDIFASPDLKNDTQGMSNPSVKKESIAPKKKTEENKKEIREVLEGPEAKYEIVFLSPRDLSSLFQVCSQDLKELSDANLLLFSSSGSIINTNLVGGNIFEMFGKGLGDGTWNIDAIVELFSASCKKLGIVDVLGSQFLRNAFADHEWEDLKQVYLDASKKDVELSLTSVKSNIINTNQAQRISGPSQIRDWLGSFENEQPKQIPIKGQ